MKVVATVSLEVQKEYSIENALTMARACGIVERDEIRPLPSGNFAIKSQSRDSIEHLFNPRYETCNCEAGKNETLCVHAIAYLIRRAQLFFVAKEDAITQREKRVALIEKSRPRQEWVEELDLM
jgi:hypothetical protein